MSEDDERKAKDAVIDPAMRAELERWFGLPSFGDLEASGAPTAVEDPAVKAARESQERALAAVDPAIVARHIAIYDVQDALLSFKVTYQSVLDPSIARFDPTMVRNLAEERQYPESEELADAMRECAPQAILRDLHRVETQFTIALESPYVEEQPNPLGQSVAREIMGTSWQVDAVSPTSLLAEARAELATLRSARYQDISSALADMPNRRVSE
jgi:hypothetical protein